MKVTGADTDVSLYYHFRLLGDDSDATALTIADFDLQYTRNGAAPTTKVDAVALAAADTAHTDNRGFEIEATSSPGVYRFDFPDAAFAPGVRSVICAVTHALAYTQPKEVFIDSPVNITSIKADQQSVTDLKHFADAGYDPATSKVQGVVLVDTTTVNADMRGTDGANTVVPNTVVPLTAQQIRDALKLSPTAGVPDSGSIDEHLDNIPLSSIDGDLIRSDTAQDGTISTITLDAGASATDDIYKDDLIYIDSGTGAGQSENISSYVGATKVATMVNNWVVAPDATSVFKHYAKGAVAGSSVPTTTQIANALLDALMTGHDVDGSFAALLRDLLERFAGNNELDRTTHKLTIKNPDASTRYALQTREKPGDANVQEVVRTAS